jgi:hypothetical protein
MTMTDAEVAGQIERADRFREKLRDAITARVVDPTSLCADAQRRTLRRISETMDQIEFITFCNLSNLDAALKNRTGTGLMAIIELRLTACGTGPTLDYADAAEFIRTFEPLIDLPRKRKIN